MNTPRSLRQYRERSGRYAEYWAAVYLLVTGHRILSRRFKVKKGEIDLIVRRRNNVAFVEVKKRKTKHKADISISDENARRICDAAEIFLTKNQRYWGCDIRYDAIYVVGWRIYHIKDAWRSYE